jgi:hypothetical protein
MLPKVSGSLVFLYVEQEARRKGTKLHSEGRDRERPERTGAQRKSVPKKYAFLSSRISLALADAPTSSNLSRWPLLH